MARIKTVKYRINDVMREIGLNCRSTGEFTCKIPEEIKTAFNIHHDLSTSTLQVLESDLAELIQRYRDANKIIETLLNQKLLTG